MRRTLLSAIGDVVFLIGVLVIAALVIRGWNSIPEPQVSMPEPATSADLSYRQEMPRWSCAFADFACPLLLPRKVRPEEDV